MCAWRESKMITPAIRQFDGFDVEVIVACSAKPWHGAGRRDKTAEIAASAGATVRLFPWKDEKDQKNWIMDKMQDKKWVLMFAPDMYMKKKDIKKTINFLSQSDGRGYGVPMITYWKDYNHKVIPSNRFNNLAIRPNERFEWSSIIKNYTNFTNILGDPVMHHLSFVRTDREMKTKLKTWSHAPNVLPNWYENKWNKGINVRDFGIENEGDMVRVGRANLPKEIRLHIERYT
jgi:hypothetical protein